MHKFKKKSVDQQGIPAV